MLLTRRRLIQVKSPAIVRARSLGTRHEPVNRGELFTRRQLMLLTASSALTLRDAKGYPRGGKGLNIFNGWPGQVGNPVGYEAAPGFSSLTSSTFSSVTSGTSGAPNTYSFLDFDAGTTTATSNLSYVNFVGCRFQSNVIDSYGLNVASGTNVKWRYCSLCPRTTFYTSPVGNARTAGVYANWPAAGTGQNTTTQTAGTNSMTADTGTQFPIAFQSGLGLMEMDHCDIWGGGNLIQWLSGASGQTNITNCYIHDVATHSTTDYHHDGPGYENSGVAPSNILLYGNVVASLGNTQALAFQQATTVYNNIKIIGNYIAGFGYIAALYLPAGLGATNSPFTDNWFGSDVQAVFGFTYPDPTSIFTLSNGTNNLWRRNRFNFLSGTTNAAGFSTPFTSADANKYILPGNPAVLSTTDWTN